MTNNIAYTKDDQEAIRMLVNQDEMMNAKTAEETLNCFKAPASNVLITRVVLQFPNSWIGEAFLESLEKGTPTEDMAWFIEKIEDLKYNDRAGQPEIIQENWIEFMQNAFHHANKSPIWHWELLTKILENTKKRQRDANIITTNTSLPRLETRELNDGDMMGIKKLGQQILGQLYPDKEMNSWIRLLASLEDERPYKIACKEITKKELARAAWHVLGSKIATHKSIERILKNSDLTEDSVILKSTMNLIDLVKEDYANMLSHIKELNRVAWQLDMYVKIMGKLPGEPLDKFVQFYVEANLQIEDNALTPHLFAFVKKEKLAKILTERHSQPGEDKKSFKM